MNAENDPDDDHNNAVEETARKRGSGKWGNPAVPRTGWECQDVIDHQDVTETCQMCEYQAIRYEHVMVHADWPEPLGCGCVCAGAMCGDVEGARSRERTVRNAAARKLRAQQREAERVKELEANLRRTPDERDYQRIMGPRVEWRTSAKGNPWAKLGKHRAVVCAAKSRFGYMLAEGDDKAVFAKKKYDTMQEAKDAAHDALLDAHGRA